MMWACTASLMIECSTVFSTAASARRATLYLEPLLGAHGSDQLGSSLMEGGRCLPAPCIWEEKSHRVEAAHPWPFLFC